MNEQLDQVASLVSEGQALLQANRLTEAREVFTRACQLSPGDAELWNRLSGVHGRLGDMDAAAECCRRVLALNPEHCQAHVNLGNVFFSQGKYEAAAVQYQTALQIKPDHYGACLSLGSLFYAMGRTEEAAASFRTAIGIAPESPQAHVSLGHLLMQQKDYDRAAESYLQAVRLNPGDAPTHNNLGLARFHGGAHEEAVACFHKALDINPRDTIALSNLGTVCKQLGRLDGYLEYYRRATALLPDAGEVRRAFMENIGALVPITYDPWLDEELRCCFALKDANVSLITAVTARLLKCRHDVNALLAEGGAGLRRGIDGIAADELFLRYLQHTINVDPELERLLTAVRRALLLGYGQTPFGSADARVARALAYQCLNNEYVFERDGRESARVAELKRSIEERTPGLQTADEDLERDLWVFGMYDRLYALGCREHLNAMPGKDWSEAFGALRERALADLIEEERIKADIPQVGKVRDDTSRLVQAQYEENPYPRWISMPSVNRDRVKHVLTRLFPRFAPPEYLDGPIRILVAGCGTGQHPILTSLTFESVDITAVDISKSSLAYAVRMARKFGIANIRFMQGDILELSALNERFHLIESMGVLHHMKDPLAGWRVLSDLLVDDGLMHIGLYSEKDRQDVVAIRNVIAREGLTSDQDSIRRLRGRILRGELGGGLQGLVASDDFYSLSGCRDLMFHVQEHRFTLPDIARALGDLGLEFVGFRPESPAVGDRYRQLFPADPEMTDLSLWDRFEHRYPHTFAKMYDFWCRKAA